MAKEKINYASMENEQLVTELTASESDYAQSKFDHAVKGLGNPMELREIRRDVARLKTEMRSRELAVMTPEELALRSKKRARRAKK